jgi:DNA-binding response OmpR family regulator
VRILVIDDDRRLSGIIKRGLIAEAYAVDAAYDGEEGEHLAETNTYDLVILDTNMPNKDGVVVCRELGRRVNTPILLLVARGDVKERVKWLDSRADNYLEKPFAFSELLAHVRALLPRQSSIKSPELRAGDFVLNTLTREVCRGGNTVELTDKEYTILEYLMRHPNAVIKRTTLEEYAWDYDFQGVSNIINVYIRRLRCKLEVVGSGHVIHTVRWVGYRLKVP